MFLGKSNTFFCILFFKLFDYIKTQIQQNNVNTRKSTKNSTFLQKVTIYLHKNIRKVRLERKINQEKQTNGQTNNSNSNSKNKSKQKNKNKKQQQQKKWYPTHFSEVFFTSSLLVSLSKICLLSTIHLSYKMILFIMSHFFVKAIIFIELVNAVYFPIVFCCFFSYFGYEVI